MKDFFFADMLPVEVFMSILHSLQHCNKIPGLGKNQHKTLTIKNCITEFRENICLKISRPDKYGK